MKTPLLVKIGYTLGILFTIGPSFLFTLLFFISFCFVGFSLFIPTAPFYLWLLLAILSIISTFYTIGIWDLKRGNYITKKYALTLCSFQVLVSLALYYYMLPRVIDTFAYTCTWMLIFLELWSMLVTLCFLQEKLLVSE